MRAGVDLPLRAIREQISSAFDVIIQLARLVDGTRQIVSVTEVLRMESDVITIQDLFTAKPSGRPGEALLDQGRPTGVRPHFGDKLAAAGIPMPSSLFDPGRAGRRHMGRVA